MIRTIRVFLCQMRYLFCQSISSSPEIQNPMAPTGKLTILPTPIGNLQDLTPNILKALFSADLIGCEDRRVAGHLYTLVKNRNIMQSVLEKFGNIELPIGELVLPQVNEFGQEEMDHTFYNYSHMNDQQRRKFLKKFSIEKQEQFRKKYLVYRAKKLLKKYSEFKYKEGRNEDIYGIDATDLGHIQKQIQSTRQKKGRGLLIPLNTYSQTKMFDLVRMLLETKHVAIISDAGMPCISDPGWKLVSHIQEKMPDVKIECVGGPSSVGIMNLLGSIASKGSSKSGRFEGFATPNLKNFDEKEIQKYRMKNYEFSIHFINSKKLSKKAYELLELYGQQQNIIIANQLTKKFQRKFHGTLKQLIDLLMQQEREFEGIGEMSYLLYRKNQKLPQIVHDQKEQTKSQDEDQEQRVEAPQANDMIRETQENTKLKLINSKRENGPISVRVSVKEFVQAVLKSKPNIQTKQLVDLIQAVFSIKKNAAKNIVYAMIGKHKTSSSSTTN